MNLVESFWTPERQITSLPAEHVISLYQAQKGIDFEGKRVKIVKFGDRKFTCGLSNMEIADEDVDLAKLLVEPMRGYCLKEEGVDLCFGESVLVEDVKFKHLSDELVDGHVRSLYISSDNERVAVDCMCGEASDFQLDSVCSIGTETPLGRVINYDQETDWYEVFTNQSVSWYIPSHQLGCTSTGSFDVSRVVRNFRRLDSHMQIESPLCCKDQLSFSHRLSALNGTCLYTSFHDQMIEYCYPDRLRIVRNRLSLTGATSGQMATIGEGFVGGLKFFGRSIKRNLNGGSCGSVGTSLILESGNTKLTLAGGSFNPIFKSVSAVLVYDKDNPYGCLDSGRRNKHSPPFIALVARGQCMFQDKTINAQRAGAVGIVIVNQVDSLPIKLMASITTAQYPDIPGGLAEYRDSEVLTSLVGRTVKISPENQNATLSVGVAYYCDPRWEERPWSCKKGDELRYRENLDIEKLAIYESEGINGFANIRVFDPFKGYYAEESVSVPSSTIRKDSEWACNGQGASAISSFDFTSTCSASLLIHSSAICTDPQFRSFPKRQVTIDCQADDPQLS